MKKTIVALALTTASSSAFALMAPPKATKTYCLDAFENAQGAQIAGTCDQSANNVELGLALQSNGCAVNQIAMTASKYGSGSKAKFDIEIAPCLPPNVAQL